MRLDNNKKFTEEQVYNDIMSYMDVDPKLLSSLINDPKYLSLLKDHDKWNSEFKKAKDQYYRNEEIDKKKKNGKLNIKFPDKKDKLIGNDKGILRQIFVLKNQIKNETDEKIIKNKNKEIKNLRIREKTSNIKNEKYAQVTDKMHEAKISTLENVLKQLTDPIKIEYIKKYIEELKQTNSHPISVGQFINLPPHVYYNKYAEYSNVFKQEKKK